MDTHPRTTNLTKNASNSVENAPQDTSVDFSHFIVVKNSEEEICEDDNEIIQSTGSIVREKKDLKIDFRPLIYYSLNYIYLNNLP